MIKFLSLTFAVFLAACQAAAPQSQQPCPLSRIDTHIQQGRCDALRAVKQTEAVKQRMLAADCGLFF